MSFIEIDLHWIAGSMIGLEYLAHGDIPDDSVRWGIVIDLVILRIMFLVRTSN